MNAVIDILVIGSMVLVGWLAFTLGRRELDMHSGQTPQPILGEPRRRSGRAKQ